MGASTSAATLKTSHLAEALGVSTRLIQQWLTEEDPKRRLVPDAWTPKGHARFTKKTIDRLVARLRKGRPKAA